MARIFQFIFLIILFGGGWYYFGDLIIPPKPCSKPIEYSLGNFSDEFGITEEYFLKAVAEAEAVWEKAYGKELFNFKKIPAQSPIPGIGIKTLKINLVYDYRQEATDRLEEIGSVVEGKRGDYDALKAKFESEKRIYESAKGAYDRAVASFNRRQAAYEEEVKYWNSRGGAPEAEYQKLEAESQSLNREAAALEAERRAVNEKAAAVNALVARLNALAKNLNLSVEHYNTVNVTRGETFEEGLYVADGLKRDINIYEFGDRIELVRVLAHEFGHALSLDHVADPEAIMYEVNQGEGLKVTEADLAELRQKCAAK